MRAYAAHRIALLHEAKLNATPAPRPALPKPSTSTRPTPSMSTRQRSALPRRTVTLAFPIAD